MPKPREIELADGTVIPILYEDRAVLAIDKPAGWLLAPSDWEATSRNLQRALESGIGAGDFWARSRNLKYLRFAHRLDAGTSGALLLVKSAGALPPFSKLFEGRQIEKQYLAVVSGIPKERAWTCRLSVEPDPARRGRMRVAPGGRASASNRREGAHAPAKSAETVFRVLRTGKHSALLEARPITGRTHQIRVHLAAAGHPVLGDTDYASLEQDTGHRAAASMALRSISIGYRDPFTGKRVRIEASWDRFVADYRFELSRDELFAAAERQRL